MRKKDKNIVFFSLLLIIWCVIYLVNVYKFRGSYKNKQIDDYKINIKVNENNIYNVDETVCKKNTEKYDKFYKVFSLKNNNNRIKIKNFNTKDSNAYFIKKDKYIFKIYDVYNKEETLNYNIKYLYNVGKDKNKNYDEFYYNLIEEDCIENLNNLEFRIEFPKKFDYKNVECYTLKDGKKDLNKISYNISEKEITGKLLKPLKNGEQVIVRVKLPENYFVGVKSTYGMLDIMYFIIPILLTIYCILLLFKNKINKKVITKYPPENLNVIELSALYKGKSEYQDIIPEIIDLANKGYIKIVEKKFGFKIIKLKEYDGTNRGEELFLNRLFLDNRKDVVTDDDIIYYFQRTHKEITKYGDEFIERKNTFSSKKYKKVKVILLLLISTIVFIFTTPAIKYIVTKPQTISGEYINYLIYSAISMSLGIIMYINVRDKIYTFLNIVILFIPIIYFRIFLEETKILLYDPIYLFGFILNIILCFVIATCIKYINRRTEEGNEMLAKIEGFKEFLKTSTKEELEILLVQNPNYFYDMLPYAITFGIANSWIKKFEDIKIKEVDWYEDKNGERNIDRFINKTYNNIIDIMIHVRRN